MTPKHLLTLLGFVLAAARLQGQNPADLNPRGKVEVFIQHLVKVARIDPAKYRSLVLEYEVGSALRELAHERAHAGEAGGADAHEAHDEAIDSPIGASQESEFLQSALKDVFPEYAEATRLRDEKKLADASQLARNLAGKSDPYLAANANLLLAECDLALAEAAAQDKPMEPAVLERVIALCEKLVQKDRLYLVDDHKACEIIAASFERLNKPLHAFIQYALLVTDYKDAPPEVVARARAKIEALGEVEGAGKPIGTVANWMNKVDKLLGQEITRRDPTQAREIEIVSALDKLIELQEARERQTCPNCGSSACRGQCKNRPKGNRSQRPAQVSALVHAKGEVLLHGVSSADATSIWGQLKERDASQALQGFRGKLPPRYERLLEQYYKTLSKTE